MTADQNIAGDRAALDDVAFTSLVNATQMDITRYVYRLVGNSEDSRDLTQETFLRAYRNRRQVKSSESARGWVYTIASNLVRDYHRRKKLLSFVPLYGWHASRLSTDEIDHAEAKDTIDRVMARLPRDAVQCLILYEIEGFTTAEVAAILGVSPAAARQRIARARKRFRDTYQSIMGSDTE